MVGLIALALFYEGWGSFDVMPANFSDWGLALLRDSRAYHTLLHIALVTVSCEWAQGRWPFSGDGAGMVCLILHARCGLHPRHSPTLRRYGHSPR